jgi:hypothetical protein
MNQPDPKQSIKLVAEQLLTEGEPKLMDAIADALTHHPTPFTAEDVAALGPLLKNISMRSFGIGVQSVILAMRENGTAPRITTET